MEQIHTPQAFWARFVSYVFSPPAVLAVLVLPVALRDTAILGKALIAVAIYGLAVFIIPVLYIAWMVRRGKITDLHIRRRDQRLLPFLVSVACMLLAWGVLQVVKAPQEVIALTIYSLLSLAIAAAITLVWKISVHGAAISGAVVIIALLFGVEPALWLSPLIPVVGAARISLKRHTPMQVVAGTGLGALMAVMVFVGL